MARTSRCRVHQDRLWDADGTEWSTALGRWAEPEAVASLIAVSAPVVVHGLPGERGAEPDGQGLTYAAQVWSRGQDRLLGFVEFC